MASRTNFGRLKDIIDPPDLIEMQRNSYLDFLQMEVAPNRRKRVGLQAVFKEVFPIESYDGKIVLDFVKYDINEPKIPPFVIVNVPPVSSSILMSLLRERAPKSAIAFSISA